MKIVGLPDIHIPFNINLRPIFKFISDFKPDVIVLMGDVHDWTPAAEWIGNQSLSLTIQTIKKCYEELHRVLLDPLREITKGKTQIKYLKGNHEYWLERAMALNANGIGYWGLEENIDTARYNLHIVPVNVPYRPCTNLIYIHGVYTNEYHAKKTVQAYHTSVLYGHTHDVQSHTVVSPIDVTHFYKGASTGCLCNLNPTYMKNKPNKWVHGFNFCYINEKTEAFHDTQVYIVNGGFWANGKYYYG